jgi:hypothetical protein
MVFARAHFVSLRQIGHSAQVDFASQYLRACLQHCVERALALATTSEAFASGW